MVFKVRAAKDKKNCFMTIRVTEEIDKELRQIASENTRTATSQVFHYIKQGIANDKRNRCAQISVPKGINQ